jgi:hypothetical protein
MAEGKIERGAAEDASGAPVTLSDVEASQKPPSQPADGSEQVTQDGSGVAGGSSGGSGGGSGMPGHPDGS